MNKKSPQPPPKTHNQRYGSFGEDLAVKFLQKKKYQILDRNFRFPEGEIDIIAEKNGVIAFIEVKTRSTDAFGDPSQAVNNKKLTRMAQGAIAYLQENHLHSDFRFDIIAILPSSIQHYQNVTL